MPKVTKKKSKKAKTSVVEPVYSVERIIKKKIDQGKVFYYLKWFGYPESDNTWEPEENLDCPDLIGKFESSLLESTVATSPSKVLGQIPMNQQPQLATNDGEVKKLTERKKSKTQKKLSKSQVSVVSEETGDAKQTTPDDKDPKYVSGFAKKWEAEEILGATEDRDEILFLMKWLGQLIFLCIIIIIIERKYQMFYKQQKLMLFCGHVMLPKVALLYIQCLYLVNRAFDILISIMYS